MFKNSFKIAWRSLRKNKGYAFINIGGLALGMAVVILISLWVLDEMTYNTYHKDHDRIAQIYNRTYNAESGEVEAFPSLLYTVGSILKEKYPDHFEQVLRANWVGNYTVSNGAEVHTQIGEFIENGVIDLLSLKMLKGTNASMEEVNAIILSESAAKAIFGQEDPIDKSLKINNEMDAVVKGVYRDLPDNNRFSNVRFFANWELFEASDPARFERVRTVWDDWSFNSYVKLKPGITVAAANNAINTLYTDYGPDANKENFREIQLEALVYPMDQWHLYSEFVQGKPAKGRITFVKLFIGIGIFVLLLACINFMNLSTARSEKRSKEVGIRKTVGSGKKLLILQFLGESLLTAVISLGFAFVLVLLTLPWFNELAGKEMALPWDNLWFWSGVILFTVVTGMLAGSYPALYLSSFNPIQSLKGGFKAGKYATTPRKALVIVQFSVSIVLAIGTIIVFNQIQFTKNRPVGYTASNLISTPMNNPDYEGKYDLLRAELKNTGYVKEITQSGSPLTGLYSRGRGFNWPGKDPERIAEFGLVPVTHDYGGTVGWEFVDGRDFSRDFASDSLAVIINEAAVELMQLENPVGTFITSDGSPPIKIIGVTKNMIMESPYEPVVPVLFFIDYDRVNYMNIRLNPNKSKEAALSAIEQVFATVVPSVNFDYRFVDEEYATKFRSESRLGNLAGVFTILALLISCLGLFGLATFVAEQRTKEIGVRKVLGATVFGVWKMLSKDFLLLILIACFIAIPIAYYAMSGWLQNYEYRMEISWWIFVGAITGALFITICTVSFQAIRAGTANPTRSLRSE